MCRERFVSTFTYTINWEKIFTTRSPAIAEKKPIIRQCLD